MKVRMDMDSVVTLFVYEDDEESAHFPEVDMPEWMVQEYLRIYTIWDEVQANLSHLYRKALDDESD